MRETPPHLLLTNYAMLEYLLLRPADMELFEGKHGGHWRFVVLDEAHVYDGAKAEEVGMLLRRLRERVNRQDQARTASFQAIATSATVGDHPRAVVDFAAKLFDAPFEWVTDDPARQDLVGASAWPSRPGRTGGRLARRTTCAWPATWRTWMPSAPTLAPGIPGGGGAILVHERTMAGLRGPAGRGATAVRRAGATGVPGRARPRAEAALAALVAVGARVRDGAGTPVLSARYHLFARATEGAFTCLRRAARTCRWPATRSARSARRRCSSSAAASGAGRCTWPARWSADSRGERFTPRPVRPDRRTWLLLDGAPMAARGRWATRTTRPSRTPRTPTAAHAMLCGRCGALSPGRGRRPRPVRLPRPGTAPVRRLSAASAGAPTGCLACGARGTGMIRLFESGNEAAAAVLATALYQALPPAEEHGGAARRRAQAARVQRQPAGGRVLRALPGVQPRSGACSAG